MVESRASKSSSNDSESSSEESDSGSDSDSEKSSSIRESSSEPAEQSDEEYKPDVNITTRGKKKNSAQKLKSQQQSSNGQLISSLNKIMSLEVDTNGSPINKKWNEIIKISVNNQVLMFGKILGIQHHSRPEGTRAEYLADPLRVTNSWSDETFTWLRKPTSNNNNSNNNKSSSNSNNNRNNSRGHKQEEKGTKRGRARSGLVKTSESPPKKKVKLKRKGAGKNNNNASIDPSGPYASGIASSHKIILHFYVNPSDSTDFIYFGLLKSIHFMMNKNSNGNRFKINLSSKKKNIYNCFPSSDKISTVIGGDVNIMVMRKITGKANCPDKLQWTSDDDYGNTGKIFSASNIEMVQFLEIYGRNTLKDSERKQIVMFVEILIKIGLRPLKFYISTILYELHKQNIDQYTDRGIALTASYVRALHFLILIQTCHRDYCSEASLQQGQLRKPGGNNESERLLYNFSFPDPITIHSGGLIPVKSAKNEPATITLKNAIELAQHYGFIKFSIFFLCLCLKIYLFVFTNLFVCVQKFICLCSKIYLFVFKKTVVCQDTFLFLFMFMFI